MSVSWNASSLLQNNPAHSGRSARPEDTVHRTYSPDSPTTRQSQRKIIVETVSAPTNIAVIKYWGKKDAKLNTPINSSASITLDQNDLRAVTSAAASPDFPCDRLFLNDIEEDLSSNKRFAAVITNMRRLAQDKTDSITGITVKKADWSSWRVHIVSKNTFPTAAGLASSAAGYAALTRVLAELFNAQEEYPGQFTGIARQGSGSASRSLFGGFVEWNAGEKADGTDSIAIQVADEHHWPEIRALILVVSDAKKGTSSTAGMGTSVETSELLRHRAANIVPGRLAAIKTAFLEKDFATFGKITMQESNQFHATCLDTYPPIFYLNDVSRTIIRMVHAYNEFKGEVLAAYTFDAGPNAVIYTTDAHLVELTALMKNYFDAPMNNEQAAEAAKAFTVNPALFAVCDPIHDPTVVQPVKYMYSTSSGPGARPMAASESLIDRSSGMPLLAMPPPPGAAPQK